MTDKLNRFGLGARFVPASELSEVDLGPLKQFVGEWESVVDGTTAGTTASGWNFISVPGIKPSFIFEIIPYREDLKFSAVAVQAGNRGPVINGNQIEQEIFGLFYEQQVTSVCNTPFCDERGFSAGTVIHAETGMFLNVTNVNGGFNIARLSTIPHGNAVLALGGSTVSADPGTTFFPPASTLPFNLDGSPITNLLGYNEIITLDPEFAGVINHTDPNTFLQGSLQSVVGTGSVTTMTTLDMTTNTPDASAGILNIPFIDTNVKASKMDAIFWLEEITGGSESELLQYTQTINLVFPPTGTATPIVWPHITINTLKRKSVINSLLHGSRGGVPQL